MKNARFLIIITLLVSLMLACNISIGDAPPPPAPTAVVVVVTQLVVPDTAVPQTAEPTQTPEPLPTETEAIVATSTASAPVVTPLKDPVNCRYGPSIFYDHVTSLNVGAFMPIIGKSADGGWWQVAANEKTICWVGASVTTTSGELSGIQAVAAPEGIITDVKLQIKPSSFNLGKGCTKIPNIPFTVRGIISTNGPLTIKWHIETEQNGVEATKTLKFAEYGPHDVSWTFVPQVWEKGNYWIRIVVTSPISIASDTIYNVSCQ